MSDNKYRPSCGDSAPLEYTVYRQDVWADEESPGSGWEPFAASVSVVHNGLRDSLGGGIESVGETIWWRMLEGPRNEQA